MVFRNTLERPHLSIAVSTHKTVHVVQLVMNEIRAQRQVDTRRFRNRRAMQADQLLLAMCAAAVN